MDTSPFAKLPAELRNRIYTDALRASLPLEVVSKGHGIALYDSNKRQHPLALTLTCKAIQEETHLLFFDINRFAFQNTMAGANAQFRQFCTIIGEEAVDSLRSVTFAVDLHFSMHLFDDPRIRDPEAETALGETRNFAVEHPRCRTILRLRLNAPMRTAELNLRDLSETLDSVMDRFRTQDPAHWDSWRIAKMKDNVSGCWRSALEKVQGKDEAAS